ncbi:helix-turn-helix transcriptional regulator [Serratia liquefaciens]|uniref:Helix-turn-helix transcriptional regulator n=1 Tax=Serratia liquefaciens TaxID=614 RepID=A0A515D5Q7_SERLI|nr:LuxR C-terminal-related transcriptional regulator [Serratia liquefaciens]QDL35735.1 helix-turn-helix transcriptional regulator [Serratia liquefaciens]
MKPRDTCKPVTKMVVISSPCSFTLHAMTYVVRKHVMFLFKNHDDLALYSTFNRNIEFDDVIVHVPRDASAVLRLVQKFITLRSPPRILALVDNAHVPTLKLLRAMGIFLIFSLHDSLSNIRKLLQDSSIVRYMSSDLHAAIKAVQPAPVWASTWDSFDGVQYLTPTETEIILDLLQGVSHWQIAKKRFVSVKTVSTHKLNALRKMELRVLNEFLITPRR